MCVCGIMQVVIAPKLTKVVPLPITFSMDRHNEMLPDLDLLILTIIQSTGNYKRIMKFVLLGKDMDSMRTIILQHKSTP